MPHTLTLDGLTSYGPCERGLNEFVAAWGDRPSDQPFSIGDVAAVNGTEDAMWCLRTLGNRRDIVAAVMPAVKRASKHTKDQRVHDCIASIDKWLAGDDSVDLNAAARAAAAAAREVEQANGAERAAARATEWTARAAMATDAADWATSVTEWAVEAAEAAETAEDAATTWGAEHVGVAYCAEEVRAAAAKAMHAEQGMQRNDLILAFPPLVFEDID